MLLAALLTTSSSFSAASTRANFGAQRAQLSPRMALGLGSASPFGASPFSLFSPSPEVLYESGTRVDLLIETLHITKRRVSGGCVVRAPPEDIWAVVTDYEAMPEIIPNILSNSVHREAEGGRVTIEQESLLSRRLDLKVQMGLEAIEDRERWQLTLRRMSGHGFLEFEAVYSLQPRADGTTYLGYTVELVPCPLFPLPMVERKIRKETPRMLHAVGQAALASGSSRR